MTIRKNQKNDTSTVEFRFTKIMFLIFIPVASVVIYNSEVSWQSNELILLPLEGIFFSGLFTWGFYFFIKKAIFAVIRYIKGSPIKSDKEVTYFFCAYVIIILLVVVAMILLNAQPEYTIKL